MGLTVLTDEQIRTILENLTPEEYDGFGKAMTRTLHEYSTRNNEAPENDSYHQPHRVTTQNQSTGATTLYMPSCSPLGMGCKGTSSTGQTTNPQRLAHIVVFYSSSCDPQL